MFQEGLTASFRLARLDLTPVAHAGFINARESRMSFFRSFTSS